MDEWMMNMWMNGWTWIDDGWMADGDKDTRQNIQ